MTHVPRSLEQVPALDEQRQKTQGRREDHVRHSKMEKRISLGGQRRIMDLLEFAIYNMSILTTLTYRIAVAYVHFASFLRNTMLIPLKDVI